MRTFIAIELEEETKAQLAEVQAEAEKLCRRGNYTPKENFHLTLHFLGEVQEEDLDYLQEEEITFWKYVESGRKPPLILPEI